MNKLKSSALVATFAGAFAFGASFDVPSYATGSVIENIYSNAGTIDAAHDACDELALTPGSNDTFLLISEGMNDATEQERGNRIKFEEGKKIFYDKARIVGVEHACDDAFLLYRNSFRKLPKK